MILLLHILHAVLDEKNSLCRTASQTIEVFMTNVRPTPISSSLSLASIRHPAILNGLALVGGGALSGHHDAVKSPKCLHKQTASEIGHGFPPHTTQISHCASNRARKPTPNSSPSSTTANERYQSQQWPVRPRRRCQPCHGFKKADALPQSPRTPRSTTSRARRTATGKPASGSDHRNVV